MLADIDISLLTATSAIGKISGQLEFSHLPRVGELISLQLAIVSSDGFNGQLTVEHVIHMANSNSNPILMLSDIVATSEASAQELGGAFSEKYGLFFEPYGD